MILTIIDKEILKSYHTLLDGLAEYLGNSYEIVLHSLEDFEKSVIHIVNGEHTGRTVGAPITDMALDILNKMKLSNLNSVDYFTYNKQGEPLKSTTIAIRGENQRIIGLLCMNFYMNSPLVDILKTFSPQNGLLSTSIEETFVQNSEELLDSTIQQTLQKVSNSSNISLSNKNKEIIRELHEKGIFTIKNSVPVVAEKLGISINTVYLHIRNNKR